MRIILKKLAYVQYHVLERLKNVFGNQLICTVSYSNRMKRDLLSLYHPASDDVCMYVCMSYTHKGFVPWGKSPICINKISAQVLESIK